MLSENPVNSTIRAANYFFPRVCGKLKSGRGLQSRRVWFPGNTCRACVRVRLIAPLNATVEYHLAFMVKPCVEHDSKIGSN